jgi:hypothetical protein
MTRYVYVGVPQWSSTKDSGLLGGPFRQEVGDCEGVRLSIHPLKIPNPRRPG